jgi:ABC-type iron transport system FetAB permease component
MVNQRICRHCLMRTDIQVLKTVNNVPGLKRLVKAVLNAIPRLISVGYLLTFIFLLFGE